MAEARWSPVQLPPASSFGTAAYLDHLMLFHGEECSQLYSWKLWVAAPISSLSPGPNTIRHGPDVLMENHEYTENDCGNDIALLLSGHTGRKTLVPIMLDFSKPCTQGF